MEPAYIGMPTIIFRFASRKDLTFLVIGFCVSFLGGFFIPFWRYTTYSKVFYIYADTTTTNKPEAVLPYAFWYLYLGAGGAVSSLIQQYCFRNFTENLMAKYEAAYFKALLRQDVSWHETQDSGWDSFSPF
jgi:ABC-type multidrug transport system fused ATPase/permease subunit